MKKNKPTVIRRSGVSFKCPKCGFLNKYHSMDFKLHSETEIVRCDDEEGGCGKEIVIRKTIEIHPVVKAYEIKGYNE